MDYNSMTIPQLREYAAGEGIDLAGATRKQDIVNVIEAAKAAQKLDTDTSKDGKGKIPLRAKKTRQRAHQSIQRAKAKTRRKMTR